MIAACSSGGGSAPLAGGGAGANASQTPTIDVGDAGARDSCGLPVGTAVCECAELPFADLPTVWLVLDRSASMAVDGKWDLLKTVVLDVVQRLGPRIRIATSLYPRAASSDQCAPGRIAIEPRDGDRPAGSRGATWSALRQVLAATDPQGGTPLAATLAVVDEAVQRSEGRQIVVLTTDGAPNCAEDAACEVEKCLVNIESSAPGCEPRGPTNCCDPKVGTPLNCFDDEGALRAVRSLASHDVDTYVLGAPGSEPYRDLLDSLAAAGATERYYAVTSSDVSAFQQAMSSIAAKILATCTIPLGQKPGDPSQVNVLVDGTAVPASAESGFTLDGTVVTVHGGPCEKILAGEALDVRVVVGCPTLTVN